MPFLCPSLQTGGHIYYLAYSSQGFLGMLDASECPPTFGAGKTVSTCSNAHITIEFISYFNFHVLHQHLGVIAVYMAIHCIMFVVVPLF